MYRIIVEHTNPSHDNQFVKDHAGAHGYLLLTSKRDEKDTSLYRFDIECEGEIPYVIPSMIMDWLKHASVETRPRDGDGQSV